MGAWRRVGLVMAVLASGACGERGENGLRAEFARLDAKAKFSVESATPQRAAFQARGRRVVVEPPSGFCLATDSLNVAGGAAFVLVADCADAGRAFPGILTVSVSDRSMADSQGGSGRALVDLQSFLTTPEGLALLGRGEGSAQVRVVETRKLGDALYVLVEDTSASALPILAPQFWRAFVDVNDRMVLTTISGFRDVAVDHDALLGQLARQVVRLREANLAPLFDDEVQVARSVDGDLKVPAGAVVPSPQTLVAEAPGSGDEVALAEVEVPPLSGPGIKTLAAKTPTEDTALPLPEAPRADPPRAELPLLPPPAPRAAAADPVIAAGPQAPGTAPRAPRRPR